MDATEEREGEEMKPPLRIAEYNNPHCKVFDVIDSKRSTVALYVSPDDSRYIVAAVNACHRLGLTVEELEAGAIAKLVEAAVAVVTPSPLGPKVTWLEDGSPKIDAHDSCVQFAKDWAALESALAPFRRETP